MNQRLPWIFFGGMSLVVTIIAAVVIIDLLNNRAPVEISGYRWERTYRLEQLVPVEDYVLRGDPVPEGVTNIRDERGEVRVPLNDDEIARGNCEDIAEDLTIAAYMCDITRFDTYEWQIIAPLRFVEENRDIDTFQPEINTCETPEPNCQRVFDFTSTRYWIFFEDRQGDIHDCRVDETTWREVETGQEYAEVRFVGDELVCDSVRYE